MGCLAEILAIIALIVLWAHPLPHLWWWILGVFLGQALIVRVFQQALKDHGMRDKVTLFWSIVAGLLQLALIVLAVISFFVRH
jgi:hypothetical protein